MINTRHSVFETNSSSTHSISISHDTKTLVSLPLKEGKVHVGFGEFGWEQETYNSTESKLAYAATFAFSFKPDHKYGGGDLGLHDKYKEMLETVLKRQTGAKEIIYDAGEESEFYPYGYIDHQSMDTAEEMYESLDTLRNFIFNPDSYFETDNDNH